MKFVGTFFRWLLTMNTVWGLMIVSAFAMTVYKENTAAESKISSSLFKDGANELVITVPNKKGDQVNTSFTLTRAGGTIDIPPEYCAEKQDETPYLVGVVDRGDKTVLRWYSNVAAQYTIQLNGSKAAAGNLVKVEGLTNVSLEYAQKAFDMGLKLVATMVLFLGMMKIGEEAGLVQLVARAMRPIIRLIFPELPADHPATGTIIMFFTTSVLGVGNASTPFGILAMRELQKLNKYKNIATDSMVTLLAWSTSGIQLVPTSMIAIRKSAGCRDPLAIIAPCLVAGTVATVIAIVSARLIGKLSVFSVDAAVAEDPEGACIAAKVDDDEEEEETQEEQNTGQNDSNNDSSSGKKKGA